MEPITLSGALLFVAVGLAGLAGGGELLVRGAINASRLLKMPPVVIGLTVVAFATSLPELAVSMLAAKHGNPDLAVGNVVGSNMFNIAVIIGVTALLFPPLRFRSTKAPADVGVMIFASLALILLGWDGRFGKLEGTLCIAGLGTYLWLRVRAARSSAREALDVDAEAAMEPHGKKQRGIAVSTTLIFLGAGLLTIGAEALVRGAIVIAREAGVGDRVIALTLVSAGTGVPELATAIVAGIRRHTAVAIGNVIGSNIFNVFGILGAVAIVHPIPASAQLIHQDALWMLGISLLTLVPVVKPGRNVTRVEGTLLLAVYASYMVWLFRY